MMNVRRREQRNAAMAMLTIIPAKEFETKCSGIDDVGSAPGDR
jgi:hypothetical protein